MRERDASVRQLEFPLAAQREPRAVHEGVERDLIALADLANAQFDRRRRLQWIERGIVDRKIAVGRGEHAHALARRAAQGREREAAIDFLAGNLLKLLCL